MVAEGLFEVRPMEEFENSMKVLLRLSDRQHERVPVPPGQDASRCARSEASGSPGARVRRQRGARAHPNPLEPVAHGHWHAWATPQVPVSGLQMSFVHGLPSLLQTTGPPD